MVRRPGIDAHVISNNAGEKVDHHFNGFGIVERAQMAAVGHDVEHAFDLVFDERRLQAPSRSDRDNVVLIGVKQ